MPVDVVIVGLGVMGCAASLALARRGQRVVGIERFSIGNDRGSSHGDTRVIRLGYFEHPSYVPMLRSAYRLWRDLEAEAGARLLHITGIAEIGPPDGQIVQGTLQAVKLHDLPHEYLDARETMRRFPAFRLPMDYRAVIQPDGGYLLAEAAVQAFASLAANAGAKLHVGETVLDITSRAGGVRVTTDRRAIDAGTAIVTAGAWLKTLLPRLPADLPATRQVLGWFEPRDASLFDPGRFPVFILENPYGNHYGFPLRNMPPYASLLKVAKHDYTARSVDPDNYDRTVQPEDEAAIRVALKHYLPAADGRLIAATTCLYTITEDKDFVIDRLPGEPHVIIASPCSGHGFKFAPAIGEILANLVTTGRRGDHDISRFRLSRLAQT
jgi:sarcosine oxidase